MKMEERQSIVAILMERDKITKKEAEALKREAKAELDELLDNGGGICQAEDICYEYFGLEPDYLEELLDF